MRAVAPVRPGTDTVSFVPAFSARCAGSFLNIRGAPADEAIERVRRFRQQHAADLRHAIKIRVDDRVRFHQCARAIDHEACMAVSNNRHSCDLGAHRIDQNGSGCLLEDVCHAAIDPAVGRAYRGVQAERGAVHAQHGFQVVDGPQAPQHLRDAPAR